MITIDHEIRVQATPDRVFDALATAEGLKRDGTRPRSTVKSSRGVNWSSSSPTESRSVGRLPSSRPASRSGGNALKGPGPPPGQR